MLKKLKNDKKGFTLVELIVVLVILAILAALLVPALTGYIDKAKEKSIIAETRSAVMAAQTLADEAYGTKAINGSIEFGDGKDITATAIKTLAEVGGTVHLVTFDTTNKSAVKTLVYEGTNGKWCKYTKPNTASDKAYVVSDSDPENTGDTDGQ